MKVLLPALDVASYFSLPASKSANKISSPAVTSSESFTPLSLASKNNVPAPVRVVTSTETSPSPSPSAKLKSAVLIVNTSPTPIALTKSADVGAVFATTVTVEEATDNELFVAEVVPSVSDILVKVTDLPASVGVVALLLY